MTLLQSASIILVTLIVFILTIASYLFGYRVRKKILERNPARSSIDLKPMNGMLLGLLGLLLAFTFGMSNSRFDRRRELIIEEANIIGTTILRTDMYPDSIRTLLRTNLKEYVNTRVAFYHTGIDFEQMKAEYKKGEIIANEIWRIAANYAKRDDVTTRTSQLIPSINEMIDIANTRRAASEGTIPDSIMYFLFLLCWCSAFLLGYDQKDGIDWIVVMGFAVMLSATVFNILDLDRPRSGLIDMDVPNKKIVELQEMFNER